MEPPRDFTSEQTSDLLKTLGALSKSTQTPIAKITFTETKANLETTEQSGASSSSSSEGVLRKVAKLVSISSFRPKEPVIENLPTLTILVRNITDSIRRQDQEARVEFSEPLEEAIKGLYSLKDLQYIKRDAERGISIDSAIADLRKACDEINALKVEKLDRFDLTEKTQEASKPSSSAPAHGAKPSKITRSHGEGLNPLGILPKLYQSAGALYHSVGSIWSSRSGDKKSPSENPVETIHEIAELNRFVGPHYPISPKTVAILRSAFKSNNELREMFSKFIQLLSAFRVYRFNIYSQEPSVLQSTTKPALILLLEYALHIQVTAQTSIPASGRAEVTELTKELLQLGGLIQNTQANIDYFMAELTDPKLLEQKDLSDKTLIDQPIIVLDRMLQIRIQALISCVDRLDTLIHNFSKLQNGDFRNLEVSEHDPDKDSLAKFTLTAIGLKNEAQLKKEIIDKITLLKAKIASLPPEKSEIQERLLKEVQKIEKSRHYAHSLNMLPAIAAEWIHVKRNTTQAFIQGVRLFGLKHDDRIQEFKVPLDLSSLGPLEGNKCKSVIQFIYNFDNALDHKSVEWLNVLIFAMKLNELKSRRQKLEASRLRNKDKLAELDRETAALYINIQEGMKMIPKEFESLPTALLHDLISRAKEGDLVDRMQKIKGLTRDDIMKSTDDEAKKLLEEWEQKLVELTRREVDQMATHLALAESNLFLRRNFFDLMPKKILTELNTLEFLSEVQKIDLVKIAAKFCYEFAKNTEILWMTFGVDDDSSHFSISHQANQIVSMLNQFLGPRNQPSPLLTENLKKALCENGEFRELFHEFLLECISLRKVNYPIFNKPFARLLSPSAPRHLDLHAQTIPVHQLLQASPREGFDNQNAPQLDPHLADFMHQMLMEAGFCMNLQLHTDNYISILAPRSPSEIISSETTPTTSDLIKADSRSLRHSFFSYQETLRELQSINAHFNEFLQGNLPLPVATNSQLDRDLYPPLFIIHKIEELKKECAKELMKLEQKIIALETEKSPLAADARDAFLQLQDFGYIEGAYYKHAHKSEWKNLEKSETQPFIKADRVISLKNGKNVKKITVTLDLSPLGELTGSQCQQIFDFIYWFEEKLTVDHSESVSNFFFASELYKLMKQLKDELAQPNPNAERIKFLEEQIAEANHQIEKNFKLDPQLTEDEIVLNKQEIELYQNALKAHLDEQKFDLPLISSKVVRVFDLLEAIEGLTPTQKTTLTIIANRFAYEVALKFSKMFIELGFEEGKKLQL